MTPIIYESLLFVILKIFKNQINKMFIFLTSGSSAL